MSAPLASRHHCWNLQLTWKVLSEIQKITVSAKKWKEKKNLTRKKGKILIGWFGKQNNVLISLWLRLILCPINPKSIFRYKFWIKSTFLGKKWAILPSIKRSDSGSSLTDHGYIDVSSNWWRNNNVMWFYINHNWKMRNATELIPQCLVKV